MTARLKVLALTLTALALVPVGAHLFELPNKIGTDRDTYFAIQRIYAGWTWFGAVLIGAVVANLALGMALRREWTPALLAMLAAALIAGSLVVFFVWTYPANQATDNWTTIPADWQRLRLEWEVFARSQCDPDLRRLSRLRGSGDARRRQSGATAPTFIEPLPSRFPVTKGSQAMAVRLNHTIIAAHDRDASALFLTEMLGLAAPAGLGPFAVVPMGDTSLDYMDAKDYGSGADKITSQHYAFLVSEQEFDEIFARIQERQLPYWADPGRRERDRINHWDDGRGVYFEDPNGHLLEIITRPYGSGGTTASHPHPLIMQTLNPADGDSGPSER